LDGVFLSFFVSGDSLEGVVNVRLQMYCSTTIKLAYYASQLAQRDICTYCAEFGAERDRDTLKTHHIVLSSCAECMRMVKIVSKRIPNF